MNVLLLLCVVVMNQFKNMLRENVILINKDLIDFTDYMNVNMLLGLLVITCLAVIIHQILFRYQTNYDVIATGVIFYITDKMVVSMNKIINGDVFQHQTIIQFSTIFLIYIVIFLCVVHQLFIN